MAADAGRVECGPGYCGRLRLADLLALDLANAEDGVAHELSTPAATVPLAAPLDSEFVGCPLTDSSR